MRSARSGMSYRIASCDNGGVPAGSIEHHSQRSERTSRTVQTGSQRTSGYELGVNGDLTKKWRLVGG